MIWHNINEEDGASLNFLSPFIDVYETLMPQRFGVHAKVAMELKGDHVRYFLHDSFLAQLGRLHQDVCRPGAFGALEENVVRGSNELHAASEAALSANLDKQSDATLCQTAANLSEKLCDVVGWGLVPALVDLGGGHITRAATRAIENQVASRKLTRPFAEYFAALTTPAEMTLTREEEISAIELALSYQKEKIKPTTTFEEFMKSHPRLLEQTQEHASRFAWAYFGYCGPALTTEKAFEKTRVLLEQSDLEKQHHNLTQSIPDLKAQQAQFQKELRLNSEEAWHVEVANESMRLKTVRKDAMLHCAYALDFLVREIARRSRIPLSLLRCAKADELEDVFSGKLDEARLAERNRCTVYLSTPKGGILLEGINAEKFSKAEFKEEKIGNLSELKGQCAHPGYAKGTVRIIDKADQMAKMKPGDILVSIATTPEIVPVMKKAAAIVAEVGGITSHAAIVSRELRVPCLIGTKIATKWLRDGEVVEVDATNGFVRKI